ncbi:hypothetical protein FOPE_07128 [Fonsecaea pedrosoi]|nr:hypothetical protein FOPE_07128 [Fonsecaea pedrosoi]
MYPCPEFYRDIPDCLRPTPQQENVPHPIEIDFLAFPKLRDALIDRPEIYQSQKRAFERNFASCLRLQWPEAKPLLIMNDEGEIGLDPAFEAFAENIDHGVFIDEWHDAYPTLSEFVNRVRIWTVC